VRAGQSAPLGEVIGGGARAGLTAGASPPAHTSWLGPSLREAHQFELKTAQTFGEDIVRLRVDLESLSAIHRGAVFFASGRFGTSSRGFGDTFSRGLRRGGVFL